MSAPHTTLTTCSGVPLHAVVCWVQNKATPEKLSPDGNPAHSHAPSHVCAHHNVGVDVHQQLHQGALITPAQGVPAGGGQHIVWLHCCVWLGRYVPGWVEVDALFDVLVQAVVLRIPTQTSVCRTANHAPTHFMGLNLDT